MVGVVSTQGAGLTQRLATSAPGVIENRSVVRTERVSLWVWLGRSLVHWSLSYNYVTMSGKGGIPCKTFIQVVSNCKYRGQLGQIAGKYT